jgi:uncharacterized damage-inducible protein DinB
MGSITEIIAYINFGRSSLMEAIEGLSHRELTQAPIYDHWTIKDILAHIIGWDQRVIKILPLIVQDQANLIPGVEVEEQNQQAVAQWRDRSMAEVLMALRATHRQIVDFIGQLDYPQIDMRHERDGRIITIRSYVIQIMVDHELQHAVEIEQWCKKRDQMIDRTAIKLRLDTQRARFMALLDHLDRDEDVLDKRAVGVWSISDVVGHIADWEQLMFKAMLHIHDPSLPPVPLVSETETDWNDVMAARRANKSWPENYHYLRETQTELADFIARLKPGDWRLRGPYPWPNDRGTLAELVEEVAEHYEDHLPDLARWLKEKGYDSPA